MALEKVARRKEGKIGRYDAIQCARDVASAMVSWRLAMGSSSERARVPLLRATETLGAASAVLRWVIVAKLVTLALLGVAALHYPERFNLLGYINWFRGTHGALPTEPPGADVVAETWDGGHYLTLVERGYRGTGPENVFYPLYPLLVRCLRPLCLGNSLAAALLLSTTLGVLALLLIHEVVRARASPRVADAVVISMCVQPAAFFTCLPYSESLFLFLTAAVFLALLRGRLLLAASMTALLALTRPVGIFVALPVATVVLRQKRSVSAFATCLVPLLGTATYFAIMTYQTGDPFRAFAVEKHFLAAPSLGRMLHPMEFAGAFLRVRALHGFSNSLLDRLAFVGVIASLVQMLRRTLRDRIDLFLYTALLGVVPAVTLHFMSYLRYASVLFPVFIPLAEAFEPPHRRKWLVSIWVVFLALQLWLFDLHVHFRWAG